jgi:hypothetical protein
MRAASAEFNAIAANNTELPAAIMIARIVVSEIQREGTVKPKYTWLTRLGVPRFRHPKCRTTIPIINEGRWVPIVNAW